MAQQPEATPRAAMVEVTFESAFRQQARDALADDGLMVVHATNVLAVLDDRARLRRGWLRSIQAENSCAATGKPCRDPCACVLEQVALMEAASAE
jgi:hypothetical protein